MPPYTVSPTLRYLSFGTLCENLIDAIFKVEVSSYMPINKDLHMEWKQQLSQYISLIPPPILKESFVQTQILGLRSKASLKVEVGKQTLREASLNFYTLKLVLLKQTGFLQKFRCFPCQVPIIISCRTQINDCQEALQPNPGKLFSKIYYFCLFKKLGYLIQTI